MSNNAEGLDHRENDRLPSLTFVLTETNGPTDARRRTLAVKVEVKVGNRELA
jgi:hypothetical protein